MVSYSPRCLQLCWDAARSSLGTEQCWYFSALCLPGIYNSKVNESSWEFARYLVVSYSNRKMKFLTEISFQLAFFFISATCFFFFFFKYILWFHITWYCLEFTSFTSFSVLIKAFSFSTPSYYTYIMILYRQFFCIFWSFWIINLVWIFLNCFFTFDRKCELSAFMIKFLSNLIRWIFLESIYIYTCHTIAHSLKLYFWVSEL